jgi:glutamate/tyrosine decarboxylase-like PLP-dependent enzyme
MRLCLENGTTAKELFSKATDLMFNHSLLNGHPKFFGYITSSPAPLGALADLLAAVVNPNVGANILSPMATKLKSKRYSGWQNSSVFLHLAGLAG